MIKVKEIKLLTKEEYQDFKDVIPLINELWWLCSPGGSRDRACSVNHEGSVYPSGSDITYNLGVRPLLIVDLPMEDSRCYHKAEKLVGSNIHYGDYTWTILKADAGVLYVLCDQLIATHNFNIKDNDWNTSNLKCWLETEGLKIVSTHA
jgi:hypothetical protein